MSLKYVVKCLRCSIKYLINITHSNNLDYTNILYSLKYILNLNYIIIYYEYINIQLIK